MLDQSISRGMMYKGGPSTTPAPDREAELERRRNCKEPYEAVLAFHRAAGMPERIYAPSSLCVNTRHASSVRFDVTCRHARIIK